MPSIDLGSVVGPTGATGATGPQGIQGPQGLQGPPGYGVIPGGAENSFLAKNSAVDYDTKWMTLPQIGSELVKADNPVGAALSGKASNPNLLDNWYFADPINQRGQTEYTGDGYSVDRFYFYGVTVSLLSDYITVSVSSESNSYSNFSQRLEYDGNFGNNTTVCFSVLCRPENPFSIAIYNLTKNQWLAGNTFQPTGGADGWAVFSAYCNIGADIFDPNDLLGLNIYPSNIGEQASGSVDIKAVKLEIGPVQTLAHQDVDGNWVLNDPPPNKALELAKCQRYYQKLTGDSSWMITGLAEIYNNTSCVLYIPISVPMRTIPSVAFDGLYINNVAITDIVQDQIGPCALKARGTLSGPSSDGIYMITQNGSGYLSLDADL